MGADSVGFVSIRSCNPAELASIATSVNLDDSGGLVFEIRRHGRNCIARP